MEQELILIPQSNNGFEPELRGNSGNSDVFFEVLIIPQNSLKIQMRNP